jgi:23S rRNA pseudouridine1911/1915/1917 synthase
MPTELFIATTSAGKLPLRVLAVKAVEPMVIFEDDDLLVVDKPANLVCHSADRPTLADWLRAYGIATPRLVNRLDRETSGLVIVAKSERAGRILGKQALRREIEKEYLAICWGEFSQETGIIDQPIAVTGTGVVYTKRIVDPAGKPSVTGFAVERRLTGFTVARLRPKTGRAHQLRVHMAWLGHSIVGDKIYGPDERLYLEFIENGVTDEMLGKLLLPRHALHAAVVTFRHSGTQQPVTYRAALPEDLEQFIAERS